MDEDETVCRLGGRVVNIGGFTRSCILQTTIMIAHGRLTHVCEFECQLELVSAYLWRPATLFCVRLSEKLFNLPA